MFAARYEHWIAFPPAARFTNDARVFVPAPRPIDEDEAVAGITEFELQFAARG